LLTPLIVMPGRGRPTRAFPDPVQVKGAGQPGSVSDAGPCRLTMPQPTPRSAAATCRTGAVSVLPDLRFTAARDARERQQFRQPVEAISGL